MGSKPNKDKRMSFKNNASKQQSVMGSLKKNSYVDDAFATAVVLSNGVTLKNRLVKVATTESLADEYGNATPALAHLYGTIVEDSGVGLIVTGNILTDRRYLERPGNLVIDAAYFTDKDREPLRAMTKAGQLNGTKIIGQVGHAGLSATTWVSKRPFDFINCSEEELIAVRDQFVFAARVMEECGFDGIQLHAAHGFLLAQILSGAVNKRKDGYGGDLRNRARLLIETIEMICEQRTSAEFMISVKLNTHDLKRGGISIEQSLELISWLEKAGMDILEVNGGNMEAMTKANEDQKQETTKLREANFLDFMEAMKAIKRGYVFMATGGFRTRNVINYALGQGMCDLIGIGKPLCVDVRSTERLLTGAVNELPQAERYWTLPSLRNYPSLQKKWGNAYNLSSYAKNKSFELNVTMIGEGKFKPLSNETQPNLINNLSVHWNHENTKAKALKGYKPDPYLQGYIGTSKKVTTARQNNPRLRREDL